MIMKYNGDLGFKAAVSGISFTRTVKSSFIEAERKFHLFALWMLLKCMKHNFHDI